MLVARPLRRVRVWSRNAVHAAQFARRESDRHGIEIEVVADVQRAVDGASIICTTTAAREPLVKGDWLAPGAHINAVGACVPSAREIDASAVARSRIYADSRESIFNEAGDFLLARAEGAVADSDVVAELGDVIAGKAPGRGSADEITLFKSLGLGVEDVAATWFAYSKAKELGRGMELPA
jgi:ornithine cyclodeaminase